MWLDTVRIARDLGDVSQLLPDGITLADAPYNITDAISKGLIFLHFMEELPEEERPPKAIWQNAEKLQVHFEAVKKKREAEMKGEKREIEDPVDNQAAKDLMAE